MTGQGITRTFRNTGLYRTGVLETRDGSGNGSRADGLIVIHTNQNRIGVGYAVLCLAPHRGGGVGALQKIRNGLVGKIRQGFARRDSIAICRCTAACCTNAVLYFCAVNSSTVLKIIAISNSIIICPANNTANIGCLTTDRAIVVTIHNMGRFVRVTVRAALTQFTDNAACTYIQFFITAIFYAAGIIAIVDGSSVR